MAISAGAVYLDIAPKLAQGFASDVEKQIGPKLDDVGDKVGKNVGSKIGSGIAKGVKMAVAGIAVAGGAAAVVGKQMFDLGANLEALGAKSKTVFGDQLGAVEKWAAGSAAAMGLTKSQAVGLAAGFGDLLIPMGFTRKAAADMSTKVVGLSGALAEWSGGKRTAAEVSEILQAAMLGERESLKGLGISITEEDVKARLAAKGQSKLTGALLQQAQAVATQELIFEKSKDAQAAYAAGTAKGIRAQSEFTAKVGEAKEALAKALYPILTKVMTYIADNVEPAIAKAKATFEAWKPTLIAVGTALRDAFVTAAPKIKAAVETVVGAVRVVIEWVSGFVAKFRSGEGQIGASAEKLGGIFSRLKEVVSSAVGAIRVVVEAVVRVVTNLWDRFGKDILQFAQAAWNGVLEVVRGVVGAIGGVFDLVKAIFTGKWGEAWEALKAIVVGAWDAIFGVVRYAITGLGDFLLQAGGAILSAAWSFLWNSLKTLFDDIWDNVIFKGITAAWGVVERFFTETIPSKMADAGQAMWGWIVSGLEAILNTAIAMIEEGINLATAPLRGAAGLIDKVTPGSLPDILKGEVNLPRVGGGGPSGSGEVGLADAPAAGSKTITVNQTFNQKADPLSIAKAIAWEI
jgi:phage-related protein